MKSFKHFLKRKKTTQFSGQTFKGSRLASHSKLMLVNCAKVLAQRGRTQRAPQTRTPNVSVALDPKCWQCPLLWNAVCFSSCKFTTSLKYREWGQPHLTAR